MPRFIFDSVPELLELESLQAIVGGEIESVEREPFEPEHFSGSTLERIRLMGQGLPAFLILKEFHPERDWVMRLTHDSQAREAMLFRYGTLAQLPPRCESPIVAIARAGESWATLMRDVSESLVDAKANQHARAEIAFWLDGLAGMHGHFLGDASLKKPELGLSSLEDFVTILAPQTVQRELEAGRTHFVLEAAARGWKMFDATAPEDVNKIVAHFQAEPQPLLDALGAMPFTLVHADFKTANLGVRVENGTRTLVLLDWQDATLGAPFLDLGYFVAVNGRRFGCTRDQVVQLYADALAKRGVRFTAQEGDLGLFAGGALRLLWQMALSAQSADADVRGRAQKELEWWYDLVRRVGKFA